MNDPETANFDRHYAPFPDDVDPERIWSGIAAEVWATEAGRSERIAGSLLRSPGLARALVVTPSLLISWLLATVVVLGIGVYLTYTTDTPWVALLAPALAGAGIANAYGPGVDPAFELTRSMPVSHRMILLTRTLAVFGVNALLGLVASLISPGALDLTIGWLVPMTTISAIGLAAATWAKSANVGLATALISWGTIITVTAINEPHALDLSVAVRETGLIPVYLVVTVVMIVLTLYASNNQRERSRTWQLP